MVRRLALLLYAGCASTQPQPITFLAASPTPSTVAGALSQAGQPPDRIDRIDDGNVITTRWLDTGLADGFVGGHAATVFRRYVAIVASDAVTLRIETERCARGSWDAVASVGACELLQGLLPRDREALAALAARVCATVGKP